MNRTLIELSAALESIQKARANEIARGEKESAAELLDFAHDLSELLGEIVVKGSKARGRRAVLS